MSDSRLEKFIYAICSMDVSDLPVPLSRIEKLWNCLITGETPDFEPLSRNEKYLMAMLDRYELENLPKPMSRGEKLLYKIAVGETDLSDVPGYLSRYEESLKYLIENGGIGDFEYVLYTLNKSLTTLYSTKEKPIKSAILTGQTLVNICKNSGKDLIYTDKNSSTNLCYKIKDNTWYYLIINVKQNTLNRPFRFSGWTLAYGATPMSGSEIGVSDKDVFDVGETGVKRFKIGYSNIPEGKGKTLIMFAADLSTLAGQATYDIMLLEYQDGMENWDIPYFEGMQSVKMPVLTTTGKNLFDGLTLDGTLSPTDGSDLTDNTYDKTDFIKIKPNESYTVSNVESTQNRAFIYDENKQFTRIVSAPTTFTTESNEYYIRFRMLKNYNLKNMMVEQGAVATSYEPYKSNILTVNEDVVLRGVGEVQDTLDCLTGEVTERIGEIVLDGSGYHNIGSNTNDNYLEFIHSVNSKRASIICDKVFTPTLSHKDNIEYIRATESGIIGYILKSRLSTPDIEGLKAWLSSNNVTVQYQLAQESIKTVDLTTVDQDGQPTKLKTFNDISYVEINADPIIPSVDVEVATKISETLATLDPQQNDISNTQNELGQTIDEQTENTDATMMATTEIYEQIL